MPRHVLLEYIVASVCRIPAHRQMPRLQRYRIKAHERTGAIVAYADEVLIVIAGVPGVVESVLPLPMEAPISAIGHIVEAQSRVFRFGDIGRKIDDVAFVAGKSTIVEVSSAAGVAPVPGRRPVAAGLAGPVSCRLGGRRRAEGENGGEEITCTFTPPLENRAVIVFKSFDCRVMVQFSYCPLC